MTLSENLGGSLDSVEGAAEVRLSDVTHIFPSRESNGPEVKVLDRVTISVRAGEFLSVIGPSGCGKSTLLNCIAGLQKPTEGVITIGGQKIEGPGPERAVVFQNASLLPWFSVLTNVAYSLRLQKGMKRRKARDIANRALSKVGLADYGSYYPRQLSGGMQQRVNLARALAVEPAVMLMDEPFGALDALTREAMQDELIAMMGGGGRTTVFITHDIEEAVYLSDRVIVMGKSPGRVLDDAEVPFARPRTRSVVETAAFGELTGRLRSLLHADD